MATSEDLALLVVRIEATQKQFEKQMKAVTKSAGDAATGIENKFKKANDNIAASGKGVVNSMNQSRAAAQNLSFQLNDMGTSLAGGASAFQVAAQQGGQFVQALNQAGGGVAGIKAVGAALTSLLSPTTAITLGLIYLTGKAYEYFTTTEEGTDKADKVLDEHRELIVSVAKTWGDAVPALKEYADQLERAKEIADLEKAVSERNLKTWQDIREALAGFTDEYDDVTTAITIAGNATGTSRTLVSELGSAYEDLRQKVEKGTATSADFNKVTDLSKKLVAEGTEELVDFTKEFGSLAGRVKRATDEMDKFNKEAAEAARQKTLDLMNDPSTWRSGGPSVFTPGISEGGTGTILPFEGPTPDKRPLIELEGTDAEMKALNKTVKETKDSFDGLDGVVNRYVNNVVKAESGGKANAKNPLSSATGLGQFIESTWLSMFKQHFPDRAKGMSDSAILALRTDADISRKLIEEYARSNAELLRAAGVSVNEAALHLAHFLGPGGAISVLKAPAGTPIQGLLSQGAINANPTILGGGATTDSVIAYAQKRASAYDDMTAATKAAHKAQKDLNRSAQEFTSFGTSLVSGFVQDLRSGVSAADALRNALNKVLDKVIEIGLNTIFGGGGGGGIFGGLSKLFGMAQGGIVAHGKPRSLPRYASGGISRSAAIFGEAGPEAAVPLPDGRSIPVTIKAPGPGAKRSNDVVTIQLQDDSGRMAAIADQRIETKSGTIINIAVDRSNRSAPAAVSRYQQQRLGGDYRNG